MKVHDSARKHGIDPQDATHAAQHAAFVSDLDDNRPARQLRLGLNSAERLLEVVVLRFDNGNEPPHPRHEGTTPVPRPPRLKIPPAVSHGGQTP